MNIAFDAKRIAHNKTGLGNYGRFILKTLVDYAPENNYFLATYTAGETARYAHLLEQRNVHLLLPQRPKLSVEPIWRNWGIASQLKELEIDIFHGLSNELPLTLSRSKHRRIASVVTIHDLIYLKHPSYYKFVDRKLYAYKYHRAAHEADAVIAVSERTKQDLIAHLNLPSEKISVVYQGCSSIYQDIPTAMADWAREHYHLPANYMLFVGSLEERKNLALAVKALAQIDEEIHLVAVGKRTPYTKIVEELATQLKVRDRLHLLHEVSDSQLPGLYRAASLFVYPSRYEGFGIPIIEAMTAGLPTIVATGSCLEEAAGPHSLYTHPDDAEELAHQIKRVLGDSTLRREMVEMGQGYVKRFSPKEISRALKKVYAEVMLH